MAKRIIYVLEHREPGQLNWNPIVSGVRRSAVVKYQRDLVEKDFERSELRVVEYGPVRFGKVDR